MFWEEFIREKMPISVVETLTNLNKERYRAIILHAIPEKSSLMSEFCQRICHQNICKYLDLLELFIQKPILSNNIDIFSPNELRDLLIQQSKGQSLLIVDRVDFILDTWRKAERQDFLRFIDNQWDSFKDGMKAKLMVVLQTSQEIGELKILDSHGQSRIFQLNDFNDIG